MLCGLRPTGISVSTAPFLVSITVTTLDAWLAT